MSTCFTCHTELPYAKRNYKYCSHSCRAKTCNSTREIKRNPNWHRFPTNYCLQCNTLTKNEKYCSRKCRKDHTQTRFEQGTLGDRLTMKTILLKQTGHICAVCRNTEWLSRPIALELDHTDGNAGNNLPNNLRLICPNCHSTMPTWKARNKGSGRKARGLPLY